MTNSPKKNLMNAGSLQAQRNSEPLNPSWFSIEERTTKDWLCYLKRFAKHLNFYNEQGQITGNWSESLPDDEAIIALSEELAQLQIPEQGETAVTDASENLSSLLPLLSAQFSATLSERSKALVSRPDTALLIACLQLMKWPKAQFAALTQRHLDYFYKNILRMQQKQGRPNKVHLAINLDDAVKRYLLPKGLSFDAGTDIDGNTLRYVADESQWLNHSKIVAAKTLAVANFVEVDDNGVEIHSSQMIISEKFNSLKNNFISEKGFMTFGDDSVLEADARYGDIGLKIESPLLWLSGGVRTVTLDGGVLLSAALFFKELTPNLTDIFDVDITTINGTVRLSEQGDFYQINATVPSNNQEPCGLTIVFEKDFPAIALTELQLENGEISPAITLLVKQSAEHSIVHYNSLKDTILNNLTLTVDVVGLDNLLLSNDQGELDPQEPGEILGAEPIVGSELFFSHPEIAVKEISTLSLSLNWVEQPHSPTVSAAFEEYYQPYKDYLQAKGKHDDIDLYPTFKTVLTDNREQDFLSPAARFSLFDSSLNWTQSDKLRHLSTPSTWLNLPHDELEPRKWPIWYQFKLTGDDFGHGITAKVSEYFAIEYASKSQQNTAENLAQCINEIEVHHESFTTIKEQKYVAWNTEDDAQTTEKERLSEVLIAANLAVSNNTVRYNNASNRWSNAQESYQDCLDFPSVPDCCDEQLNHEELVWLPEIALKNQLEQEATNAENAYQNYPSQSKLNQLATLRSYYDTAQSTLNNYKSSRYNNRGQYCQDLLTPIWVEVPTPYTPRASKATINYQASVSFETTAVTEQSERQQQHQLIHLHPLGHSHISESGSAFHRTLVKQSDDNGYLDLTLMDITPPDEISIFFKIASIDRVTVNINSTVKWYWLSEQGWSEFFTARQGVEENEPVIISDSTNELLNDGILRLKVPENLYKEIDSDGNALYHIQARFSGVKDELSCVNDELSGVNDELPRYSKITAIHTQVITATFANPEQYPIHLEQSLAANTIESTLEDIDEITEVLQPYISFDQRPVESQSHFYTRTSERLRHKDRAIAAWDYERLILEEFPQLHLVRAIRPKHDTNSVQCGDYAVNLVVVPKVTDSSILQPQVPLFLKKEIKEFICQKCPPWVTLSVLDPVYLEVKFTIKVNLHSDVNSGHSMQILNDKLVEFFNPWNSPELIDSPELNKKTANGEQIYLTDAADLINQLPFIKKLFYIKATSRLSSGNSSNIEEGIMIKPSSANVIVVPATKHDIELLGTDIPVVYDGVNTMKIGYDFTVL